MIKKIIFTALFLASLIEFRVIGLSGWLIVSLVIQTVWLIITSSEILRLKRAKNKIDIVFKILNQLLIFMLITDFIIFILSMSFGFRLIFANLYIPTFYISLICIIFSIFSSYYTIFNYLINSTHSQCRRILIGMSSLFYPIGVYMLTVKIDE